MNQQRIIVPLFACALSLFAVTAADTATPAQAAGKKAKVSIQLNKKKLSLQTKQKYKLKAKVKPAKAKVTWKSSKPKTAAVSKKGKVTAKSKGTATITVTARYKKVTKKATCKVTVNAPAQPIPNDQKPDNPPPTPASVKVQDITTAQASYTIEMGKTLALNASVSPANATNKNLTYTSDNAAVASVDANGQIQAASEGTAKITITAADGSGIKKEVQVTILSAITSIQPKEAISLKVGETSTLSPSIEPAGATLYSCRISNSKDYVASVDESGKITAKYPGITVVDVSSALNPDVKTQFRIQVTDEFAPPDGFDKKNDAISHGSIVDIDYESVYRPTGKGHALAWLPPDYDKNKQYNLLFCLHGGNDNEYYWTSDKGGDNDGCSADKVLDNAYANGLIEDTIVVFTSGVIRYKDGQDYPDIVETPRLTDFWKNHYLLEFEIINVLLPYIRQEYPVMTGPEHTGICGLSMGCAQTMEIGLKHPDLFDYVGCFSAGPFEADTQPFVTSKEDADRLNSQLKLLFFITGENDHMRDDSMRNFVKTCDGFGVNHVFYEVPGRGHDDPCWDRCLYAFMKYAFK